MEKQEDIRWEQRFSNYIKALQKLAEARTYILNKFEDKKLDQIKDAEEILDEIIKEGLIQRFEYTFELAWNVMKDYALYQGNSEIGGSRDAIRFANSAHLIDNAHIWMDMIKSRIKTSHTYNEETADEIFHLIIHTFFSEFVSFQKVMEEKRSGKQENLFD